MKNKFLKIFLVGVITIMAACSESELEILTEGTPGAGNFWKTDADAISAANSLYDQFGLEEFYGRGYMWYICASDDMIFGRNRPAGEPLRTFSSGAATYGNIQDQWLYRYKVIKRANDIINHVPQMKVNTELKNRVLGEAYFLAGLMYFELAYTYGAVPIVKPETTDFAIARPASVSENYAYIAELLTKAAEYLPYFDQLSAADYGRAHKTAALAYLAKTYLFAKDYANAEKAADGVIASGKHQLLAKFKDVFTTANNWSKEYIWSVTGNSNPRGGSPLPGIMLERLAWGQYNGWGYFTPTKELYDAFQVGDERKDVTILKPGDTFTLFGSVRTFDINNTNSDSKMQFNKYMEPFSYPKLSNGNVDPKYVSEDGNYPTTSLNVPLMRYAEVLLIKAEAALMQGKNADVQINAIRNRAGLSSISGATMTDLKRERRCELAGEFSNRHADLVRWGDAAATYAQPLHRYDGALVPYNASRTFNPEIHGVWPIPQKEIDNSNGLIKQNPGW